MLSFVHLFGCFWHGLALWEIKSMNSVDTWLHSLELQDKTILERYIYSIYFLTVTMTSVGKEKYYNKMILTTLYLLGYGDVSAKNYIECFFVIITLFLSSITFAYSINAIGSIL